MSKKSRVKIKPDNSPHGDNAPHGLGYKRRTGTEGNRVLTGEQAKRAIQFLTVSRKDAAAMLGVDIQTIDGWISARVLRASKKGRRVLIRVASIEAMLDEAAI
jgi:hypothetical protein